MDNSLKLYKLMVLYMLSRVDFPLTNSQISEFILDKGYTTYFKLQQTFSELLDSHFIVEESTHGRTLYHLTEEGRETASFFSRDLSSAILEDIDSFLLEKRYDLKDEVSIQADYFRNTPSSYTVSCRVIEKGQSLIHLEVTVPSEEEARQAVRNFRRKNQEIYSSVMEHLLSLEERFASKTP